MAPLRGHLQPDEEVVYLAHPTQLVLLLPLLLTLIIFGSAVAIWFQTTHALALYIGLTFAVLGLLYLLVELVVLRSKVYVVTTRRILKQTGVFSKRSTDTYFDKINNVDHYQSFWGRLLGYGDVDIDTASETGTTNFPMVANPLEFKRAIVTTAQQFRSGQLPGAVVRTSGSDRMRQLKTLLDDGLISQAEYEEKRKKVLEEL